MFCGAFSPHSATPFIDLTRLRRAMEWDEGKFHEVNYHGFSGGFFLDPRLPHTPSDCLYLDVANELLVLMRGSIYNQTEVCSSFQLTDNGLSIPALVAHLFLKEGPGVVAQLNGDFAIAIYQPRCHALFLFRDHFGNVPVVYTSTEQSFVFSTDTLALCRAYKDNVQFCVNPLLANYKPVDLTLTPNARVLMLKPGHWLRAQNGTVNITKYWHPERIKTDNTLTREQLFQDLNELLTDAVRIRSSQRFVAGSHLSGGLDSSLVSAMARREYAEQSIFHGYSWTPANAPPVEGQTDERVLIQQIGGMAGISPVFFHLEPRDLISSARNGLHNHSYIEEEKVWQLANSHKTNLLFSGWGGDEFFSLTSMGIDCDLVFKGDWKAFFTKNPLSDPMKIMKYLVFKVFLPAIGYVRSPVLKSYIDCMYYLTNEHKQLQKKDIKTFEVYRSRQGFHLNMIYNYHISERTGPWCVTGYKNGVVYRYPLLDVRLVEYMLKVPSRLLIDGQRTRIIPRNLSAGLLPESVRWQPCKNDPALFALAEQQLKERGLLFINEVADFKANPDLHFIDFDVLESDIRKYRTGLEHHPNLFSQLVVFKFFHEFTKSYQQEI